MVFQVRSRQGRGLDFLIGGAKDVNSQWTVLIIYLKIWSKGKGFCKVTLLMILTGLMHWTSDKENIHNGLELLRQLSLITTYVELV